MDAFVERVSPKKKKRQSVVATIADDAWYNSDTLTPSEVLDKLSSRSTLQTAFGGDVVLRLSKSSALEGPTLLLVGGGEIGVASDTTWARVCAMLSDRHVNWATVELPGHGSSTLGNLTTSAAGAAEELASLIVLAIDQIHSDVVLVGTGLGGGICIDTLLRYPDLAAHGFVVGCVLLASEGGPRLGADRGFTLENRTQAANVAKLVGEDKMASTLAKTPLLVRKALGNSFVHPELWDLTIEQVSVQAAKYPSLALR